MSSSGRSLMILQGTATQCMHPTGNLSSLTSSSTGNNPWRFEFSLEFSRSFTESMNLTWSLFGHSCYLSFYRFIEWIGCCCSGFMCKNVKEEKESYAPLAPLCRDGCCKHYVRTRACETLSRLPSLMPLYSG